MQYADPTQPDPMMMRPRIRRRMLEGMGDSMGDSMGGNPSAMEPIRMDKPLAGPSGMPASGNTGIGGGRNTPVTPMPKLARDDGSALPIDPNVRTVGGGSGRMTPVPKPQDPAAVVPPAPAGGTYRDVLQGAIKSNLGTIHAAQGDDARKAAAEQVIRGVLPQLEAMGVAVEDVRNEKIKIGGRWYDLLRDVEGAAAPQFLDVTDPAPAAQGGQMPDDALRGMGGTQTSLIDQIRASIMQLMGNGQGVG